MAFISQYPPEQSLSYVKATSYASAYFYPHLTTDHTQPLTGGYFDNSWVSSVGSQYKTNQRFHIDLGSEIIITKVYYENGHDSGANARGAKNFTLWGSNDSDDFGDLVYANDGTWVPLTTEVSQLDIHVAANTVDPKYFLVTNTTAYRYYAFKFADNWGDGNAISVRRIELQTAPLETLLETDTLTLSEDTVVRVSRETIEVDENILIGEGNVDESESLTLNETNKISEILNKEISDSTSLSEELDIAYSLNESEALSLNEDIETLIGKRYNIKQDFRVTLPVISNILNSFSMARLFIKNINNKIRFFKGVVADIKNNIRTRKQNIYDISNNVRMILESQRGATIPFVSLGKEYIKVYINNIEQTDVDVDSINIRKAYNTPAEASFTLLRPYDGTKPSLELSIVIRYNNYNLFEGYITQVSPTDSPDTISIECKDAMWKSGKILADVKIGIEPLSEGRTRIYRNISGALVGLGVNFGIGGFVPEYERKENFINDIITELVSSCGNYAWCYEGSNPTLITLGGGNIIDLDTQELNTNLNLYQVLKWDIKEDADKIINQYYVNTGGIIHDEFKADNITQNWSQPILPTSWTYNLGDPEITQINGSLTPKWKSQYEMLAIENPDKDVIDGYDTHPKENDWKYASVFTRYMFQPMSSSEITKVESYMTSGGISKTYNLITETKLSKSEKTPAYLKITLPGTETDGYTHSVSLQKLGCVKKPVLYGGIDKASATSLAMDPAELEDAITVAEDKNLVDATDISGYLMHGFTLDGDTGLVKLHKPIYSIYTGPTTNWRSPSGMLRPLIEIYCYKETKIKREEVLTESEELLIALGIDIGEDVADSYPDISEEQPTSDNYDYKFKTSKFGSYPETIVGYLQLNSYSIKKSSTKIDSKGVRSYVSGWNDLPYATDLAEWELSKTGNIKYTGNIIITLDAFYFYNIKLNSRVRMSKVSSQTFNVTNINYNISDFTVSLTIETFDPYKRTKSLQYHGA